MDFLTESLCGKDFLKLLAQGSGILAELLRLSNNIPKIFLNTQEEGSIYKDILFEFEYLKNSDEFEEKIAKIPDIENLEEGLFERYSGLIRRFMELFASIISYSNQLNKLMSDIVQGNTIYVENFEMLLSNDISKQVILESYYFLGVMLIFLENLIPGPVREKIVVCHVRIIGGQNTLANLHEITKLCKKTGFLPSWYPFEDKRTAMLNLPQDKKTITEFSFTGKMFARMGVDAKIVKKLIWAVKDGDIYNEIPAYPNPEHRSFALANQAAMLFVVMYFTPDFLTSESSKLRELIDKHFADNWIVPVFMGYVVDLTNEWQTFDAAKRAIENTISPRQVKRFAEELRQTAKRIVEKLDDEVLQPGRLVNEFVLRKMDELLTLLRDANTSAKWLMLHRLAVREELKTIICDIAKKGEILNLLLYTSQYELILYKHLKVLIETRDEYWINDKTAACDNMSDISEFFSDRNNYKNRKANTDYSEYFAAMAKKIEELTPDGNNGDVSRKIQKYIPRLEEIEKMDQIENNLQVRQYINDTKKRLKGMLKVLNLKKRLLSDFRRMTDCSYSFLILKDYIPNMQKVIEKDASSTLLLRATFMKLSSIMDAPMSRIIQLDSLYSRDQVENVSYNSNFKSVSNYYSTELMNFVKEVLQVIPRRVFELAGSSLVEVLTQKIKSMPGEIDQEDLRDYALFEKRAKIASCIGEIAVYMRGVMNMDKYMIGNFQVVPMNILEEGLKYELLITISDQLDQSLRFSNCSTFSEFEDKLTKVGEKLDSLKCSVEYIQDLVCVYGLKIWYDEYNKLVSTYVDVEWNYIRRKELPDEALKWASSQNDEEYMNKMTSKIKTTNLKMSENSLTFLGRVINALLVFSDPKRYTYVPNTLSFFDEETKTFSITMGTFSLIKKCIGASGMYAIDKLLSFMIVSEMYAIQSTMQKLVKKDKSNLQAEAVALGSLNTFVKGIDKYYMNAKKRNKPFLDSITQNLERIGHLAILRILVLNELNLSSRKDSQKLYMLLEASNEALVNEMVFAEANLQKEEIEARNTFVKQLAGLSVRLGFSDPVNKVYFKPKPVEYIPLTIMYCFFNIVDQVQWDPALSMLVRNRKNKSRMDPLRFVMGANIFFNQYSEDCSHLILYYIAQYLRSISAVEAEKKNKEEVAASKEVSQSLMLLFSQFAQVIGIDHLAAEQILPISMLHYSKNLV